MSRGLGGKESTSVFRGAATRRVCRFFFVKVCILILVDNLSSSEVLTLHLSGLTTYARWRARRILYGEGYTWGQPAVHLDLGEQALMFHS